MQKHKKFIILSVVLLIIAGAFLVYSNWRNDNQNKGDYKPPSSQNNPDNNNDSSTSDSAVVDSNGQDVVPTTNPQKSSSGKITLYSPTEGSKISSDTTVSGESTAESVQYRIKDDVRGVIGQGSLNATNGKFSGHLIVNSKGTKGTFEIYSTNPTTGAEENNIKLNITF